MFRALTLALALAAAPAIAQDGPNDISPIEDIIAGQLDAFKARNIDEAWAYARWHRHGRFVNCALSFLLCMVLPEEAPRSCAAPSAPSGTLSKTSKPGTADFHQLNGS